MANLAFYQNSNPRFQGENFQQNKNFYFRIEKLAEKHGCTPAQLALAWINHQGDDVVPIPGEWLVSNHNFMSNIFSPFVGRRKIIWRKQSNGRFHHVLVLYQESTITMQSLLNALPTATLSPSPSWTKKKYST